MRKVMLQQRVLHAASVLITALSIGYFGRYAFRHINDLPAWNLDLAGVLALLASVVLTTMTVGAGGLIWHCVLKDLNTQTSLKSCMRIFSISQFAKYIPGNFGHHIGRVIMAQNAGISGKTTAQSIAIETTWAIAIACAIAAGSQLILRNGEHNLAINNGGMLLIMLMIGAISLLPLLTAIFNRVVPRINSALACSFALLPQPSITVTALSCLLFLATFFAVGLMLYLQARYLFNNPNCSVVTLTFAFALSWVAGLVSPGAPAGLGVREAIMVALLGPLYGAGLAVSLSLSLRFVTTLGDTLAFVIGILSQLRQPPNEDRQPLTSNRTTLS